jgi:hypothetical protein
LKPIEVDITRVPRPRWVGDSPRLVDPLRPLPGAQIVKHELLGILCHCQNMLSVRRPARAEQVFRVGKRRNPVRCKVENLDKIDLTIDQMEDVPIHLERCWWSIKVQSSGSKGHCLRYDGRYLRRPPIAQRRITDIGERNVTFRVKNKNSGLWCDEKCSLEEFVDRWAQHIPEHYQHRVRYFGFFSSRSLGQLSAALFAILRQKPRPRPRRLPWAASIKQDFGRDPLLRPQGAADDTGATDRAAGS